MSILEVISLIVLLLFILSGGFVFYNLYKLQNINGSSLFQSNEGVNLSEISGKTQFYEQMRYPANRISYSIEPGCNVGKTKNAEDAFKVLSDNTVLEFYRDDNSPEITVVCSQIEPTTEDKGHFIAGEGGPSEIINTTRFNVILSGRVSLYRTGDCTTPNVAIHEILHALGFDHVANVSSIMYTVSNCNQMLDQGIIDEINRLYNVPSLPDLVLDKVDARRIGRYLDFNAVILNSGLIDAENIKLTVLSEGKTLGDFEVKNITIGSRSTINVKNLGISSPNNEVTFRVDYPSPELSKSNNQAVLELE